METQLTLLSQIARRDKQAKMVNLIHLLNEKNLMDCFYKLQRNKASGVDKVTFHEYEQNLTENLQYLVERMKQWSYRPKPVRRVFIPKNNGERRPIGIPSLEDKIVQMGIKRILEAIYENVFLPCSFGFRPGKSPHMALQALDTMIRKNRVDCIVDADIQNFFGTVHHKILMQMLKVRIGDQDLLRLIVRFLRAGVMEEGVLIQETTGTPQGGVLSPILANIYLHYTLDTWLHNYAIRNSVEVMEIVRYCDDFVIGMRTREDARKLLESLKTRFRQCGLILSEEKTRLVNFGRFGMERARRTGNRPDTFDFLGFTHYHTIDRNGLFQVGRKTSKKRLERSLRSIKSWLCYYRNRIPLKILWPILSSKVMGHYLYYGIGGNYRSLNNFHFQVERIIWKWLNRRSQRKSFTWDQFHAYLKLYPLPLPKIYQSFETLAGINLKSPLRENRTAGSVRGYKVA